MNTTYVVTSAPTSTTPVTVAMSHLATGTLNISAVCPLEVTAPTKVMMNMAMLHTLSATLARHAQEAVQTQSVMMVTSDVVTQMMSIMRTVTIASSTNVVTLV